MQYTSEITIKLPIKDVIKKFDNTEDLYKRQPTLLDFKHISGTPGKKGAKSKLTYNFRKQKFEMTETITVNNLPEEFSATFIAKGMYNLSKNYFTEIDKNNTQRVQRNEFKSKSIMMKLMMFFFPGNFKKETMKFMKNFKKFAETGKKITK